MKLIDLHNITAGNTLPAGNQNFHLYYVPKGSASIFLEDDKTVLEEGEFLAVNPNETCEIFCDSGICIDFEISYSRVLQLMGYERKMIVCNTHGTKNENSRELAKTANRLLKAWYEPGTSPILKEQYSLQLVFQLISGYSNNVFSFSDDQRRAKIESYIEANYADEMTLEDIAREFALTPQYFSKYFKDTFRVTFLKYLNQIRLRYAAEDLISSEETALRIAVNNGFPNAASFLREFRCAYGMTPSEYRKANRKGETDSEPDQVLSLLNEETEHDPEKTIQVDISNDTERSVLEPYWTQLINLGSVSALMKSGVMDQVSYIQERLHFRKARLILGTYSENGRHLFYAADTVMEFFTRIGLDLILVIDFRQINNPSAYLSYFREQCLRLARRFGKSITDNACFELMYDTYFTRGKLNAYRALYDQLQIILSDCHFSSGIIGPGVLMDDSGENFRAFIRQNPKIHTFTISCAPYSVRQTGDEVYINRLTDSGYLIEQYQIAKRILKEERTDGNILLASWKDRLNDVDLLNESPYTGARIIRNVFSGYGVFTALPLDMPLDRMFDELTFDKAFNGLPGIITAKGLRKPSFHALSLLAHQDKYLCGLHTNYLISASDESGYFQILCHNCKKPGYRYYMNDTFDDLSEYKEDLFEDTDPLTFTFRFHDLPKGKYLLKTRTVNDEKGCAFTRYLAIRYENDTYFGRGEEEYLKAAAVIPMEGQTLETDPDGSIIISCTLSANEFRHLHLIYCRN